MKTKLLSLLLLIACFNMFGKPVDETRAKTVGLFFLQNKTNSSLLKDAKNLQLAYKVTATIGDTLEERTMFYVFNVDTIGFVIVSGDDTVIPILGYSDHGNFYSDNLPPAFQKWLEGYKNEINYVVSNDIKATEDINKQWSLQISNKNSNTTLSTNSVAPLIQTYWDQYNGNNQQSPLYNNYCPFDSEYNVNTVTGCVATAMAQIMKFWNYPSSGTGFYSYFCNSQDINLSANFGNTTYQWSSMPNQLSSSSTTAQKNAIATLMLHCGISVDMNYGVAVLLTDPGSGAAGAIKVQPALVNYFGFQNATISLRSSFSETNWINLLKSELDAGRPMYYEGAGNGPNPTGHAFVCDGYDNNNEFHFNWGWSGSYDGYFQVNTLNPTNTGTGGGSGQFNSNQKIVKGIQPPASAQTYNLQLYNYLTPSASTINYGQAFSVSTNIANYGTNSFSGDYTLGAFDSNGNFIDYVETKTNYTLQSGNAYGSDLIFSTTGMFTLLPGTYYLGLYYRPTSGGWKIVQNSGSYTNFTQITVVNSNPISLSSTMTVSPGTTLTQGQGASVNLNIANNGSTTFTGQYNVGLYTLDGTFVQTIGTYNESIGLQSGYTYSSPYLTFTTPAITASPGSYLIALQHLPTNGSFTLTGSTSTFINPIRVTVVQAPYQADIYEVNDAFNQSYSMPLSFTSNTASVKTTGSNSHVGNDNDYYKIILPSGYNYTITPRLQDSYSSNNGNTYSLDALFTYSTDGVNWSSVFDDVTSGNITVNNGGTIYFHVAPYFQGNVGTYLLDVNLSRAALPSKVVISQVYGGGGNSGAPFTNDYIELFNRGTVAQNLNGWSVQYASASGTSWKVLPLSNFTLQPGQYYLIKESAGATPSGNLPTPDLTDTVNTSIVNSISVDGINLSATNGKIILVSNTTAETTANPSGAQIIDKIGYGPTATGYEGSGPTAVLSNTTASIRNLGGCKDTDNNVSDFTIGTPVPRNSATAYNLCSSLSVSQNTLEAIKLYPNPTNSKVFFDNSITNFNVVVVYNYLGQEVAREQLAGALANQELNLSNLNAGVYVLKFHNGSATATAKVVKQ